MRRIYFHNVKRQFYVYITSAVKGRMVQIFYETIISSHKRKEHNRLRILFMTVKIHLIKGHVRCSQALTVLLFLVVHGQDIDGRSEWLRDLDFQDPLRRVGMKEKHVPSVLQSYFYNVPISLPQFFGKLPDLKFFINPRP